ncbi:CAP domain-containing protein [Asticcacaulis sp. BYS171W]|uniref:CAP domain-containing protein n=1 Tax=Asticcacaulis aquaticus TaxID=2984212 RepID=A0ABT5HV36_9CAUL|nr:CAP domain-containing protein [Asticcacaulis aquaticus]MDC7683705.1 CAP domain-containing protein [Asticcacaulis aquaticus]
MTVKRLGGLMASLLAGLLICAGPVLAGETVQKLDPNADAAVAALFGTAAPPVEKSPTEKYRRVNTVVKSPALSDTLLRTPKTAYTIDDQARAYALSVLDMVNAERGRAGCPALALSENLMQAAQRQSLSMAQQDYFYHYTADGVKLKNRVDDSGYLYTLLGENIGAGQATPAQIVDNWMHSPGHRANILNCAYEDIGIGFVYQADDTPIDGQALPYKYYWTQVFGRHIKIAGR